MASYVTLLLWNAANVLLEANAIANLVSVYVMEHRVARNPLGLRKGLEVKATREVEPVVLEVVQWATWTLACLEIRKVHLAAQAARLAQRELAAAVVVVLLAVILVTQNIRSQT